MPRWKVDYCFSIRLRVASPGSASLLNEWKIEGEPSPHLELRRSLCRRNLSFFSDHTFSRYTRYTRGLRVNVRIYARAQARISGQIIESGHSPLVTLQPIFRRPTLETDGRETDDGNCRVVTPPRNREHKLGEFSLFFFLAENKRNFLNSIRSLCWVRDLWKYLFRPV